MIFADDFESGDLATWTSASTGGGDLSASTAAALEGDYGLQVVINDKDRLYLESDHPNNEEFIRLRFLFDPNTITMAQGDEHHLLRGYSGNFWMLYMGFGYLNGAYQLQVGTRMNIGGWWFSSYISISDAPQEIALEWRAASAADVNDGYLVLYVNGVERYRTPDLDNDTHRLDSLLIGPLFGIDNGTDGTYYIDQFEIMH